MLNVQYERLCSAVNSVALTQQCQARSVFSSLVRVREKDTCPEFHADYAVSPTDERQGGTPQPDDPGHLEEGYHRLERHNQVSWIVWLWR